MKPKRLTDYTDECKSYRVVIMMIIAIKTTIIQLDCILYSVIQI